jgi:hypothetical protein
MNLKNEEAMARIGLQLNRKKTLVFWRKIFFKTISLGNSTNFSKHGTSLQHGLGAE